MSPSKWPNPPSPVPLFLLTHDTILLSTQQKQDMVGKLAWDVGSCVSSVMYCVVFPILYCLVFEDSIFTCTRFWMEQFKFCSFESPNFFVTRHSVYNITHFSFSSDLFCCSALAIPMAPISVRSLPLRLQWGTYIHKHIWVTVTFNQCFCCYGMITSHHQMSQWYLEHQLVFHTSTTKNFIHRIPIKCFSQIFPASSFWLLAVCKNAGRKLGSS